MRSGIAAALASAEPIVTAEPLPLRRALRPPERFPVYALGPVMEPAVRAIMERVQCPDAIAAQSVLAAASLATQGHANIIHPATQAELPLSLFLVTVAASGERKSAADTEALRPVRQREDELAAKFAIEREAYANAREIYDRERESILKAKTDRAAKKEQLEQLGKAPLPPKPPYLLLPDPTLEGLHKLFGSADPSLGLFSDEGGGFVGGYGMNDDNRLRMAAGLCDLWGGQPIRRIRASEEALFLRGRRLSMHLMIQPGISDRLLAEETVRQQGLLSRFLVAAPASLVGTRMQRESVKPRGAGMEAYHYQVLSWLRSAKPVDDRGDLVPANLPLSDEARASWSRYADAVERKLAPGGRYKPIQGFANKLPEHALRLAAVILLMDGPGPEALEAEHFQRGATLADFYAGEALRLFDAAAVPAQVVQAEDLLKWLFENSADGPVSLQRIYQTGPTRLRTAAAARSAATFLEDHGWLARLTDPVTIEGKRVREAYQLTPGALASRTLAGLATLAGGCPHSGL